MHEKTFKEKIQCAQHEIPRGREIYNFGRPFIVIVHCYYMYMLSLYALCPGVDLEKKIFK